MKSKKQARIKRATRTRARIRRKGISRLCIHRTPKHLYAQVIAANGSEVLVSASTLDKDIRGEVKYSGNVDAEIIVGKKLGERAKKAGVTQVAFDRSGFKYHGRIKALADAAREQGLEF
jgi:large subunit ribosomal protein L18